MRPLPLPPPDANSAPPRGPPLGTAPAGIAASCTEAGTRHRTPTGISRAGNNSEIKIGDLGLSTLMKEEAKAQSVLGDPPSPPPPPLRLSTR